MTNPPLALVEDRYGGPRYGLIAWVRGEERLFYEEFGSYQGEWLMLTREPAGVYRLYRGSYGSCSGCDDYEGTFDQSPTRTEAATWAAGYTSFAEIPQTTMRNLVSRGTLKRVLPANQRYGMNDNVFDYEGDSIDRVASEMMVSVKVLEGLPVTLEDVLTARNAEVKQRALRAFGYERFVEESGAKEIDRDGNDTLLGLMPSTERATVDDKVMFLSVQDHSTDRRYLLRVPPFCTTVRQAKAWTFNLPQLEEYQPEIET